MRLPAPSSFASATAANTAAPDAGSAEQAFFGGQTLHHAKRVDIGDHRYAVTDFAMKGSGHEDARRCLRPCACREGRPAESIPRFRRQR